ncbi:MAG: VWA domain-containing protein [Desulfobacteraceae bacterium]|nr:VWA domain-containing protein [Desulfobacteraceae bacterium]
MLRFADPYFLILLAIIPLTVWRRVRTSAPALSLSSVSGAAQVSPSIILRLHNLLLPLIFYLSLVLMITALARPQWASRQAIIDTKGVNIVLAVDLSESMAALDFKRKGKVINRLEAAKYVIRNFISKRDGDRIGMVVFGTQAYTQFPLTRDYNAIASLLDGLQIGAAGKATAIGDAIGIALKRLEDIESRSNVIILLTDGVSNRGQIQPAAAADIARERQVKIYTVGIGEHGRAPFLVNDPVFGQRFIYQQVEIDETTLKKIAANTDGLYFRATNLKGLQKIYKTIDKLEKTGIKVKTFDQFKDLYLYSLLPALGLLGIWMLLKNTRFLTIP